MRGLIADTTPLFGVIAIYPTFENRYTRLLSNTVAKFT